MTHESSASSSAISSIVRSRPAIDAPSIAVFSTPPPRLSAASARAWSTRIRRIICAARA
jgi:hypothetical protein